jgi:hypothetical protein
VGVNGFSFSAADAAGYSKLFNRKGLISDQGQRKQAFYVLQKFYKEKADQTH